ncbi:hypothetical protein Pcinc_020552 [Petrolisthes cinctipes]|uniref:Uncharacterized protein n=1 Tax=Petrolisthes cinctipes TaxID=88211 RepID=A0AAE1FJ00_PETCI|nr:hypothetical protein Pcinc_020552 [Petrolisthes cinctipes]
MIKKNHDGPTTSPQQGPQTTALSFDHLQGAFYILILGVLVAGGVFIIVTCPAWLAILFTCFPILHVAK